MSSTPDELQAMKEATSKMTEVSLRLESLECETAEGIAGLKVHFDKEFQRLESQMGTMNAHLDNIVREVQLANSHHQQTNKLLEQDMADQKEARERRLQLDAEAMEYRRKLEIDEIAHEREDKKEVRGMLVGAGREVWSIVKTPLGYLVVAALGYMAWHLFGTPFPQHAAPMLPEHQVEADE